MEQEKINPSNLSQFWGYLNEDNETLSHESNEDQSAESLEHLTGVIGILSELIQMLNDPHRRAAMFVFVVKVDTEGKNTG